MSHTGTMYPKDPGPPISTQTSSAAHPLNCDQVILRGSRIALLEAAPVEHAHARRQQDAVVWRRAASPRARWWSVERQGWCTASDRTARKFGWRRQTYAATPPRFERAALLSLASRAHAIPSESKGWPGGGGEEEAVFFQMRRFIASTGSGEEGAFGSGPISAAARSPRPRALPNLLFSRPPMGNASSRLCSPPKLHGGSFARRTPPLGFGSASEPPRKKAGPRRPLAVDTGTEGRGRRPAPRTGTNRQVQER
ncbi:hypothetical protein HPB51_009644 [Rhipicephalus microplus]|uniref:Uncharacterized protein n=1 Tax=Rhipicephalus microplus TaxID=6941 RepID=A0A9J6D9C4_RHIMP|nr:hypothetical protein HPB51_009644 [Rhipicephalus microplus]